MALMMMIIIKRAMTKMIMMIKIAMTNNGD